MTEQLQRLIDSGAEQAVINERLAGLLQAAGVVANAANAVLSDHEKRIRFLERAVFYGGGVVGVLAFILTLLKEWLVK